MDKEAISNLIQFLNSNGFEGEKLERELNESISKNIPAFALNHQIDFGNEQMNFDLRFKLDHQSNSYRLDSYKATHREYIPIEHKIINGIDTAGLEQEMKMYEWNDYFAKRITDPLSNKALADLTNKINQLSAGQNFDGIKLQELLMFKYWPKEVFDRATSRDLALTYENSRDFHPSEYGICNANLAYFVVSGRLDDLYEKLSFSGIDQLAGADVHAQLDKELSKNPEYFELKYSRNEPEGLSEITVPVNKINGEFNIQNYEASVTLYPPIEHGVYNGVDTKNLEELMRDIDWHEDRKLFIFHEESEPEFLPKVGDIQEMMFRLSQDMVGADIADKLQLKYWSDATFFSDVLQQSAWDHLQTLDPNKDSFPIEIDAKRALNLLSGRAVIDSPPNINVLPDCSNWLRLDLNKRNPDGHYLVEKIEGFSFQEVEKLLDLLPLQNSSYYPIRNSIIRGDIVQAILKDEIKVLLEANPERQTINIYTPDLKPIPFNFRFDPDWKPNQEGKNLTEQKQEQKHKMPNQFQRKVQTKKGKGKGL